MNREDHVVMWSSVVLFVLTFAVFGLLLGFAAVYNTNHQGPRDGAGAGIQENVTANVTLRSASSNAIADEERR
jgi:heme/copper-type cytochrome/quinol oxidase subunit 2